VRLHVWIVVVAHSFCSNDLIQTIVVFQPELTSVLPMSLKGWSHRRVVTRFVVKSRELAIHSLELSFGSGILHLLNVFDDLVVLVLLHLVHAV